jgi:hypothetical protein
MKGLKCGHCERSEAIFWLVKSVAFGDCFGFLHKPRNHRETIPLIAMTRGMSFFE